ncbi:MAG: hypothetical protein ACPG44_09945 [Polaribacter sp.]
MKKITNSLSKSIKLINFANL